MTGEVHDQLFLDGIHLAYGWVLLTAVNQDGLVVSWQWATSENAAAYQALLHPLAPPRLVTIDGSGGALKAIKETWPPEDGVLTQRCLIHIHRNNIRDLTHKPRTPPGQALLGLSRRLLEINTIDQARRWELLLAAFHQQYTYWLKARTQAADNPKEAALRGKAWWYTHERDRRVYYRLERLVRTGTLFNYLHPTLGSPAHKTTNIVESINAQTSLVFLHHRGLSEPHALAAAEWCLYQRTENPKTPTLILRDWDKQGRPQRAIIPKQANPKPTPTGPQQWDTQTSPEDGLWTRKGWAGRWQP